MTYFDARYLPAPRVEYVAWVDVMGIQATMGRSTEIAANIVFKLHIAALEARTERVSLYPVMDGAYVCTEDPSEMASFLRNLFKVLTDDFLSERQNFNRFIVRGAIARGEVYHGRNIRDEASTTLAMNSSYRAQVLLGRPIINAHMGERHAPPFGIWIHPSAREADFYFVENWWAWFSGLNAFAPLMFGEVIDSYYAWCDLFHADIDYDPDRIKVHRSLAAEYFGVRHYVDLSAGFVEF